MTWASTEADLFDFGSFSLRGRFAGAFDDHHQFSAAEKRCELLVFSYREALFDYARLDFRVVVRYKNDDPFVLGLHGDLRSSRPCEATAAPRVAVACHDHRATGACVAASTVAD